MSNLSPLKIFTPNQLAKALSIHRPKLEAVAADTVSNYSPYAKKKPNGKIRLIDIPSENIKQIQKRVYEVFLKDLNYPAFIKGGVKGRQPIEHAKIHSRAGVVITMDIKECFPSITPKMVHSVWRSTLGCSRSVSRLLTQLTTLKGYLPQGAPTSPALANLIIMPAMIRIKKIAQEHEMREPSIYVDDLAVSGKKVDAELISRIAKEFSRIGLGISREKIVVMRKSKLQKVINKGVNNHLIIPRSIRKKIWCALHQLELESVPHVKDYRSVKGRIMGLKSLHLGDWQELMERFNKIPNPEKSK